MENLKSDNLDLERNASHSVKQPANRLLFIDQHAMSELISKQLCLRLTQKYWPSLLQWRMVPGGTEWDTTKPLDLNGLDSTRTLLVDNELYKAHRGEEDSIVMIPTWEALAGEGSGLHNARMGVPLTSAVNTFCLTLLGSHQGEGPSLRDLQACL